MQLGWEEGGKASSEAITGQKRINEVTKGALGRYESGAWLLLLFGSAVLLVSLRIVRASG